MASDCEQNLVCSKCSKSYSRPDLLSRHFRRCRGLKAHVNRRKACEPCIQAKAKCSYDRPSCSRCFERQLRCEYSTNLSNRPTEHSKPSERIIDDPVTSDGSFLANMTSSDMLLTDELLRTEFWNTPSATAINEFALTEDLDWTRINPSFKNFVPANGLSQTTCIYTPSSQQFTSSLGSYESPRDVGYQPSRVEVGIVSIKSILPPTILKALNSVCEYPRILSSCSESSTFLHSAFFANSGEPKSHMSFLPQTSMAICCSNGIITQNENRYFFRRTMDISQRRLIQDYPSQACLSQWDALHAMLVYETVELRENMNDDLETWSLASPGRGLTSSFIKNMVTKYAKSYPELLNLDRSVFKNTDSARCSAADSAWARWRITEMARRMVFLANMINFFCNFNMITGKQLSHYEPLDDDMVLSLPLPATEAAWTARDEQRWRAAVETPVPLEPSGNAYLDQTTSCSSSADVPLRVILSKHSGEYLREKIGLKFGLNESEDFRNLIILLATVQFKLN